MLSLARGNRLVALALACSLLTTGCYSHVPIRPSELPKLNGDFANAQSAGNNVTLYTFSVFQVTGEDGRTVEFKGEHDIIITRKDGTKTKYDHPVVVTLEESAFLVRSGNQPETRVPLDSIQRVQVTKFNVVANAFLAAGSGIAFTLLIVGILAAI